MELTIEKLVYGGEGLARFASPDAGRRKRAVFVPFVLKDERVEVTVTEQRAGFSRASLDRVLSPSPLRTAAPCPYFSRCGGCHYQHAPYEHQLQIKTEILRETLQRIGKLQLEADVQVHPSPAWQYRNRTRVRLHTHPEFALGYLRWGSHKLLPVEECPISSPLINRGIAAMWQLGRTGAVPTGIREVEFFVDGEDRAMQVSVYGSALSSASLGGFADNFRSVLPELGTVAWCGVSAGCEQVAVAEVTANGSDPIVYKTRTAGYRVSPGAFFQVNRFLINDLVEIAVNHHQGGTALDLYAGVGLFSAVLAPAFERVIAVESSQTSFADLQYNAPANVKTVCASVEQFAMNRAQKAHPDLILVDPPRGGLGERIARLLGELRSPRLTYVSCDPATLARDLAVLVPLGYCIEQIQLVDLFPQTFHLETVCHLVRQ